MPNMTGESAPCKVCGGDIAPKKEYTLRVTLESAKRIKTDVSILACTTRCLAKARESLYNGEIIVPSLGRVIVKRKENG